MIVRKRESSRLQSSGKEEEAEAKEELETVVIESQDEIPEDVQNELIENQPSQWSIMKQVRNNMLAIERFRALACLTILLSCVSFHAGLWTFRFSASTSLPMFWPLRSLSFSA